MKMNCWPGSRSIRNLRRQADHPGSAAGRRACARNAGSRRLDRDDSRRVIPGCKRKMCKLASSMHDDRHVGHERFEPLTIDSST